MNYRLSVSGLVLCAAVIAGCGDSPTAPPRVSAPTLPSPVTEAGAHAIGLPFRVSWAWTNGGPGAAHVVVTVTPTVAGRELSVRGRVPDGVSVVGGVVEQSTTDVAPGAVMHLAFDVMFPPNQPIELPFDVVFDINDDTRGGYTYLVRDPSAPVVPSPPHPGRVVDWGRGPAKVAGTAEPQKR